MKTSLLILTGILVTGRLTTGLEDPGSILSVTEWSGRLTTGLEDPGSNLSGSLNSAAVLPSS
uniref:Uncharacterized protein n=1 Tax=Timema bartmani TaxID=61472 RepID=A0A7R9F8W5_9NEOP|nr:unnamed protein product [Timema bartmani]